MLTPLGFFGGAPDTGAFHLLSTTVLSSAVASVTFDTSTYAAQGYKHLQVRFLARKTGENGAVTLSLNGSGLSYVHYIYGSGTTKGAGTISGNSLMGIGLYSTAFVAANYPVNIIDIVDAFSSTKNKAVKSIFGYADPVESSINLRSGLWDNTASVTSLTLTSSGVSVNFAAGARFSLYGIKG